MRKCAPLSPPEMLQESTEVFWAMGSKSHATIITMISRLPTMMSPTIPVWTVPARPMTGGKQPGKVPAVPPDLGTSSDDSSSDSDRESDHQSSAADSESVVMSETDASPRYKGIGRKTAQRRNSKTGMIAGKRLTGYVAEKSNTSTEPLAHHCYLLTLEDTKELPRQVGKAVLSKSPIVIRINIPSFLLPELEMQLKSLASAKTSKLTSTRSLSSPASPKRKSKPGSNKYYSGNESSLKSTKRSRAYSRDSDSGSDSDSERSDVYSKHRKKGDKPTKYDADKSKGTDRPSSPSLDRKKLDSGRVTSKGNDNDSKLRDIADSIPKSAGATEKSAGSRRRRSDSGSLSPGISSLRSHRKDMAEARDGSSRKRIPSKEDLTRRVGSSSHKDDRGRSTKHRSHGHSRGRSRSRSHSRSRRRSRDRNDGHEIKANRSRRDYDDDRSSSKTKRKRDTSREHYEKPAKGRRDKNRSRSVERDDSRERRRDRKRQRSISQSREGSDIRREKDKHRRELSSTKGVAEISEVIKAQNSPISHRKSSESQRESSNVAQLSTETVKTGATSPSRTSLDTRPQQDSTTTTASTSVKKFSMEDYQKRRMESEVGTPKVTTDSPALSSSGAVLPGAVNDQAQGGARRMSLLVPEPTSSGQSKYYREYCRYHTLAISLKRKADEISHVQRNPRLGAIVYFLSGNAFMRAFHFNDRHFESLYSNRPELVLKESMKCWSSMKQFTTALSAQCCDKFPGLDGLSYLLEALIYYKCHTYTNYRLRKEMQSFEQFKKRPKDGTSSTDPVMITTDLASKLMQYAEDWANLSTKLEECEVALTPDIAREQFPETFKKWCVHPEDIGNSEGQTFSMTVEQKQKIVVGVVDGVVVHDEKVRTFPKIMWPLGTYMHLSNLMDFAEEALHEYQVRNSLEYDVSL
ncbi:hypothetical protein BGX27_006466 [Mortierella sp. AM989]|nr:hypothetical protein BGX27_006466 [Mortierella sp. AM989]